MTLVVVAVVSLSVGGPARAGEHAGHESSFRALVNRERAARGLGAVVEAADVVAVARRHSARMAGRNEVFHNPDLASEVDGWELLGENVGVGPTAREIHDALMASQVHRDVILDPRFTQLGVGVLVVGEHIWLTQVFRLPSSEPPQSTSSPPPARSSEERVQAPAPPATTTAAPAPAPVPATASHQGQVARRQRPLPDTGEVGASPSTTSATEEATQLHPAPTAPPIARVVIESASPASVSVPLPERAEIPALGLVAAALLLAVVGSASVATRRAWRPAAGRLS